MTVCLLVTALCVPVSAADEPATMLYNGVELPNIDSVWTDKVTYPYVHIQTEKTISTGIEVTYCIFNNKCLKKTTDKSYAWCVCIDASRTDVGKYIMYKLVDGAWKKASISNSETRVYYAYPSTSYEFNLLWSNHDVIDTVDGSVYLAASDPVDPNAPSTPSGSIGVVSSQVLDDSASFVLNLSDLTETGDVYSVKVSRFIGETLDGEFTSESFSSSTGSLHLTAANLTPETEYRFVFSLLLNGEETEISTEITVTTLAAATADDSVDETETLSLLSAIYAAIINQNDTHLSMYDSIGNMLGQIWLRLRYIEENILALAPSTEETALKAATAETATEFTKEFWGAESDNALGGASITESADVLSNTKGLFNTGVSTSDFFGLFGDSSWGHWFSEETRADLHTVLSVSTLDLYEDEEKSTYEKNLDSIRDFMGG